MFYVYVCIKVGIYKTYDATKSVTLDPSRLAAEETEYQKQKKQRPIQEGGGPQGPPPLPLATASMMPA